MLFKTIKNCKAVNVLRDSLEGLLSEQYDSWTALSKNEKKIDSLRESGSSYLGYVIGAIADGSTILYAILVNYDLIIDPSIGPTFLREYFVEGECLKDPSFYIWAYQDLKIFANLFQGGYNLIRR